MRALTEKQRRVYEFIHNYCIHHGLPPSVREVAQALGKSAQAIQQHIEILRAKGYLDHQPSKSRANVPRTGVSLNERVVELPLLGRIQAGLPILAEENREGTIGLPREWVGEETVFLLKVEGDSMINAHILPADMVLVRKQVHGRKRRDCRRTGPWGRGDAEAFLSAGGEDSPQTGKPILPGH